MLGSMAALVMCFRCEWSSPVARVGGCPRCGVSLYSLPQPPTLPAPPLPEAIEMRPEPPARRRHLPVVALGVAGVLLAAGLLKGSPQPVRPARDGGMAEELAPVLASSTPVKVSPSLAEAAGDAGDLITFATQHEVGLYRLWRIDLESGRAIPGPVVPRPAEIRLQPGAEDRRLAFMAAGGALFSLEGFHAARPQWMTGDVSTFSMSAGRRPLGVSVHELMAPWGSGSEVRVTVARVSEHVRRLRPFVLRGLDVRGATVVGSHAFVWGTGGQGPVLMRFGSGGSAPVSLETLGDGLIDMAPNGGLLVPGDDGHPVMERGGRSVRFGLEADTVTTWSPDSKWAVVRGSIDATEGHLWLVSTKNGAARPLGAYPGAAGFSSDGRIALWTDQGSLAALDLATNQHFRIGLPSGFPEVVGPIVAG
jgi:hypothetical protein